MFRREYPSTFFCEFQLQNLFILHERAVSREIQFHSVFPICIFVLISFLHFIISRLTRTSAFVGLVGSFSCGRFSMHAVLSTALRMCVTHSSSLVHGRIGSYRTHGETTRLGYNANAPATIATDGTRDRKVAVSNA